MDGRIVLFGLRLPCQQGPENVGWQGWCGFVATGAADVRMNLGTQPTAPRPIDNFTLLFKSILYFGSKLLNIKMRYFD